MTAKKKSRQQYTALYWDKLGLCILFSWTRRQKSLYIMSHSHHCMMMWKKKPQYDFYEVQRIPTWHIYYRASTHHIICTLDDSHPTPTPTPSHDTRTHKISETLKCLTPQLPIFWQNLWGGDSIALGRVSQSAKLLWSWFLPCSGSRETSRC